MASKLTRRQRRIAVRTVQYGIVVVVVLIVALTSDWNQIRNAFFNLEVADAQFPQVITIALKNTVIYTVLGFAFGLPLGLLLALMRLSEAGLYRGVARLYIEFFRGLPALLVIISVGYGIPLAFPGTRIDRYLAITIALGLVFAAYSGETIRAGILAVPKGQIEAARSLGMSPAKTMVSIVIPQATKIVLPPITNETIALMKDTSLALFLGATTDQYELTQFGRVGLNQYISLTPVLIAGICYLILTIPLSQLSNRLEKRYGAGITSRNR